MRTPFPLVLGFCAAFGSAAAARSAEPDSLHAVLTVITDAESAYVRAGDSLTARSPARFLLPAPAVYAVVVHAAPLERWDAPTARETVSLLPGADDTLRFRLGEPSLALRGPSPRSAEALGLPGAVVPPGELLESERTRLRLYITGGAIVAAGAVSAAAKIAADNAFEEYRRTGDAGRLSRTRSLDRTAAVSLAVTQISFALFTYFLLSD